LYKVVTVLVTVTANFSSSHQSLESEKTFKINNLNELRFEEFFSKGSIPLVGTISLKLNNNFRILQESVQDHTSDFSRKPKSEDFLGTTLGTLLGTLLS